MHGKIIKGIAGFYYVNVPHMGIYECKAKGSFRNVKLKPLVGDNVIIDVLDEKNKKGNMVEIEKRKNELIRPAVANIDQAIVIFAAAKPNPNFNLLDRFLIMMNKQNIETVVCFNKIDIVTNEEIKKLQETYSNCGYKVICTSAYESTQIDSLRDIIRDKTSTVAGPSGVGKSSIINLLQPEAKMETGVISEKIQRGKHTTRHSELIAIEDNTYIMDTPGFSSLYINEFGKEELKSYFNEFSQYEEQCRFKGCVHINEPDCRVKEALSEGKISKIRYEDYLEMYNELQEKKRW